MGADGGPQTADRGMGTTVGARFIAPIPGEIGRRLGFVGWLDGDERL